MSRETPFDRSFDETRRHLELAERFLADGEELIDKDPAQASEKLYKAAEEALKAIATALKLPEAEEVAKRGRWTTGLLESVIVNIMRRLKLDELYHGWGSAYRLHVDGFPEAIVCNSVNTFKYFFLPRGSRALLGFSLHHCPGYQGST